MRTDPIEIDRINKKLAETYRVLDGRPIYRVVWSDDMLEKRIGTFTDWYGHIMIRQEHKCLREVKKYWYYQAPCYVLEKLIFIANNRALEEISLELVESKNGSYEPIYTFQDKDNNPLPVLEKVIDIILWQLHNPRKRLPSDLVEEARLAEKEETDYFVDQLSQDERPELFVWDNSAFVSTRQLEFKKQYAEPLTQLVTPQGAPIGSTKSPTS